MLRTLATLLALAAPGFALADSHATGDADAGKKVFNKCKACHAVGEGAANKVGPQLNGIIGAAAGQVEGFKYSDALTEAAAGGLVWDDESLTQTSCPQILKATPNEDRIVKHLNYLNQLIPILYDKNSEAFSVLYHKNLKNVN